MLRVNIKKENSKIKKIIFQGHADYADYGSDIVCASASSTMLCTVNGINAISENTIDVRQEKDLFEINVLTNDNITNKLLENMIRCLKSLEEQYPKNIKIK